MQFARTRLLGRNAVFGSYTGFARIEIHLLDNKDRYEEMARKHFASEKQSDWNNTKARATSPPGESRSGATGRAP